MTTPSTLYEPFSIFRDPTTPWPLFSTTSKCNHAYLFLSNPRQVVLQPPSNPTVFYNGFGSGGAERLQRASTAPAAQPRPNHFQPGAHHQFNSCFSSYRAALCQQPPPYHRRRPSGGLPISCSILLVTNSLPPSAIVPARHYRRAVFLCGPQQTVFRQTRYNTLFYDDDTGA